MRQRTEGWQSQWLIRWCWCRQMGWNADGNLNPYEYHPHRGLYYHEVHPSLYCGTQLRSTADVDHLCDGEGIGLVLNLQENKDFQYWVRP